MSSAFTANGLLQILLTLGVLMALAAPLGAYMAHVYNGKIRFLCPIESFFYKLAGIDPAKEMNWRLYAMQVMWFSIGGGLLLYSILRLQGHLPLNPEHLPGNSPDLAFNTAISFITNTNWQSYSGESAMSYFSQMIGLTVQNFLSAGTGMAVLIAFTRGFVRKNTADIGNFWVDLTRGLLYILLPLSLILSVTLSQQGVPQTFHPYQKIASVENKAEQVIAVGPVASQEAIKQLGTNGGGFYNVNSAHPYENPTPLSNFLELISILLIPAALCFTFGILVADNRQGRALLIAMTVIFIPLMFFCVGIEQHGNPKFVHLGIDQIASDMQSGGNMEGKETRFGIVNSALWASATTAASNGSVNAMHDSFTPLGGMIPMLLMKFGEVIYGGVGSGLYGMLIFAIITVFIAGLMVGRTPEYMGKKINAFEIKMASVVILMPCLLVLVGTSIAVLTAAGKAGISNPGAQGFSEILYAFTSAGNNNGSAFAGINANTPFYNTILGIIMFFGRFFIIIPVLAISGSLAAKNTVPVSAGTLPTHTPLFIGILIGVIVLVGVLTFIPGLALGPIVEYLHLSEH